MTVGCITPKIVGSNVRISLCKELSLGRDAELSDNSSLLIWPHPIQGQMIVIGKGFKIARNAQILSHGGTVIIGDNVFIGPNCQIQGKGDVVIGDNTKIAGNTYIISSDHDISGIEFGSLEKEIPGKIVIGKNVWIGAGSLITKGVSIGDYAVIGGGSVVTKSVPRNSVVAGNPAKKLK
jgi:acetyltransferase-like isoleucine patch superfamily enzyme